MTPPSTHRDPAALNWPNHRGTATAFPLSGFGLGAFFFSIISSIAFPDNTSDLLLLFSVATFTMVFVGLFFLRIIPQSPIYTLISKVDDRSGSDSSTLLKRTKSGDSKNSNGYAPHEPGTQSEPTSLHQDVPTVSTINSEDDANESIEETSSLLSKSSGSTPGDILYQDEDCKSQTNRDSHHLDIRGLALLANLKFYQLWLLLGLLTGIGLMTIK